MQHNNMALLQLTLKVISVFFGMAFFSLGIDQAGSCRPHCTRSHCVTVRRLKVDFKSAHEMCQNSNGELLTLQTNDDMPDALSYGDHGDFWIGLRLPDGLCSNLSAPLRGYEWTDNSRRNLNPFFNYWKESAEVCSPHCVSTSHDLKWTERSCSQEIDGFLCKTDHEHACQPQEVSIFFKSTKGCSESPCEHTCTEVKDGYECSCFKGYIPDSDKPRHCRLHCAGEKCPVVCEGNHDSSCFCPDGYIIDEKYCVDMDECDTGQCEHKCQNTYGSFRCSCEIGYVLKNQVNCIKTVDSEYLEITTPIFKPATKNSTLKGSSLATGGFIWIWICLAVAVIVLICVIRFYALKRLKRTGLNLTQGVTVAQGVNSQC